MAYRHNIIKDYKSEGARRVRANRLVPAARLPVRLRWLALLAGCVVLGVVAASRNDGTARAAPEGSSPAGTWRALPLPQTVPGADATATAPAVSMPAPAAATAVAPGGDPPALAPASTPASSGAVTDTPAAALATVAAAAIPGHVHTVQRGDTLSDIFAAAGFSAGELHALLRLDDTPLDTLYPGQRLEFFAADDGALARLVMHQTKTRYATFTRSGTVFDWQQHETPTETRLGYAHGVIRDSLFTAGREAGLSDRLIMELAQIFAWDIDFALDVRGGDEFTVVYETLHIEGDLLREGAILAAEFINQGRVYRAARYTRADQSSDYFTPEGHSLRKAFLRSPLNFTRISSRFDRRRKHPVLHRVRAHNGVDYSAPRGTPVWSTGDGKIVLRGVKGGYGKTVIVQHGSRYSTLYAHLSGYARGLRTGSRVRQGQIIGYVGSTGMATGPHLHYEFRVNGNHRDPLSVALPKAQPLPEAEMANFARRTEGLWQQLDVLKRKALALADEV